MSEQETFNSQYERYAKARAEGNEHNKAIVFDALAAAGITAVLVSFDGEGDSGQLEEVQAMAGDNSLALPTPRITIREMNWGASEPSDTDVPLPEAIETLCYGFLAQEHDGWENNDGACGEFRFDVGARTIELEFNARYTDFNTSNYTF